MVRIFDKIYCVTLARRPDRWEQFVEGIPEGFEETFGEIEKKLAYDGRIMKAPPYWKGGNGAWGCYNSHKRAIEEAPMPKVSIALVISSAPSLNTTLKSKYQTDISKRPSPTTVNPITEPAENATLRPLLRLVLQAFAVLLFALVAIFIPTNPESPEKNPPVTKAKGTNHVKKPK